MGAVGGLVPDRHDVFGQWLPADLHRGGIATTTPHYGPLQVPSSVEPPTKTRIIATLQSDSKVEGACGDRQRVHVSDAGFDTRRSENNENHNGEKNAGIGGRLIRGRCFLRAEGAHDRGYKRYICGTLLFSFDRSSRNAKMDRITCTDLGHAGGSKLRICTFKKRRLSTTRKGCGRRGICGV